MRVLVVEDDPVSQKLLTAMLDKAGYEVLTAGSGREAVALLEEDQQIDMLISDIMMPVMDGFDLLNFMKSDSLLQQIPVIVSSALNDHKSVLRSIELGAADYITKPVEKDRVLEKVKNAEKLISGSILIVDDEPLLRNLLERILKRGGYKTIQAENETEALECCRNRKIAAVVSDQKLSNADGFLFMKKVKDIDPGIPVLIITENSSESGKNEILANGADDYILKPFNNTDILMKLRAYTRKRHS